MLQILSSQRFFWLVLIAKLVTQRQIFSSSGYPIGSVVFYFLNLSPSSEVVSFDVPAVGLQSADLYLLQPTGGNLTST